MLNLLDRIKLVIQPAPSVTNVHERQKVYLFSAVMLLNCLSLGLASFIWWYYSPEIRMVLILANVFCWIEYALSRSPFYRWGMWVYSLSSYAIIIGSYLLIDYTHPEIALMYLAIPLMLVGLILRARDLLLNLLVCVAGLLVIAVLHPKNAYLVWSLTVFIVTIGLFASIWLMINKAYREEAQDNQQRYRDLMNANHEGILIVAYDDFKILDVNPAFERIIGYPSEEIIGRYPVEFLERRSKIVARHMWQEKDQTPHELEGKRKNGSTFYIEASLKPYTYRNQAAYVIIIQDIAVKKAAEKALIESEQRFKAIFDHTYQFMGLLEADGTIIDLNPSALNFAGVNLRAVVGKPLWDTVWWNYSTEAQDLIKEKINEAAQGYFVRFEAQLQGRNERKITSDLSITPVKNDAGQVIMLIPEGRDISANKQEEQKRREYELRYQALFKHTADAVLIIDLTGKPISANERALTMLQCRMDEILSAGLTTFVVEDDRYKSLDMLKRLRDGEDVPPFYERKMRRNNGEIFIAEISAMLVRDANGSPLYIQSMIRDTSDRRKAEQDRFYLELERERTKMLEQFIAQASHHFRTPITNIKTSLYLLPRFREFPERQTAQFKILGTELERLEKLLEDLLMVTRLKKEDSEYSVAHVDVQLLLREVQGKISTRSLYNTLTWSWAELAEGQLLIIGDKSRLARAILNIVDNAMLYTPEGGTVTIRCYAHNNWAVIEIEDTGMGIAEADMPYIFENFFRTEHAKERDSTSSGLGLPISQQIIERHRGAIRVGSEQGKGTTVQVILPILLDWSSPPPPLPQSLLQYQPESIRNKDYKT